MEIVITIMGIGFILFAAIIAYLIWRNKNIAKLKTPEKMKNFLDEKFLQNL
jgi:hypothetical protein